MAEKDIISKDIIKRLIEEISKYLFNLTLTSLEVLETQYQRFEERRADIVVKVTDGQREYLLHIEIQNANEAIMPLRMLRYRTDIAMQWSGYEIEQYLIYIGKNAMTMAGGIEDKTLNYHYHIVDMHEIDCNYFLKLHNPDALIMAILCDFKGQDEHNVIHFIVSELKRFYNNNEKGFRDAISMLEVLSVNRDLQGIVKEEETMLSARWDELPSYEIGMEQGFEKGIEQGITKGLVRAAINLYKAGASLELISQGTGLSIAEIKVILAQNEQTK